MTPSTDHSGSAGPADGSTSPAAAEARFLHALEPTGPLSHVPLVVSLAGELDTAGLARALDTAARRHPWLAARFDTAETGLAPRPDGIPAVEFAGHDLRDRPEDADPLVDREIRRPFDLTAGPVARAGLIRTGDRQHRLVITTHRLAGDRRAVLTLFEDVAAAYAESIDTAPHPRVDPVGTGRRAARADLPPVPELPYDRPRPDRPAWASGTVPLEIAPSDVARLRPLDLPAALLALYLVLVHRYSAQPAPAIAVAVDTDPTAVGCAQATAFIRSAAGEGRFTDLVDRVRREFGAASPSALASADALAGPAFSSLVAPAAIGMPGIVVQLRPAHPGAQVADLALDLVDDGSRVTGQLAYRTDRFDPATARRVVGHFRTLLDGAARDPDRPVFDLPLLTAGEERDIERLNRAPDAPADTTLPQLVAAHARRTPHAIAVRAERGRLSYAELDHQAGQLAYLLRALGVRPESVVGICMDRLTPMVVVAVVGVLRAGGAYVPVEPGDPPSRRGRILRDAGARIILAADAAALGPVDDDQRVVELDERGQVLRDRPSIAAAEVSPASLAYVLYTSGSTGEPKGIAVEHRQLTSYVAGMVGRFGADRPMRYALVQPLTVDSSVTALALALFTGGEVHVISRERSLDADHLADWFTTHEVDCLKIAPSHLRALQSSPRFAEVLPRRLLVVGGEAADWRWLQELQRMAPHCRVVNHYGPTETTVGVLTLDVLDHPDADWDTAPIGIPLPGSRAYVTDAYGRPVPAGVAGELLIGGANLARGYHGQPGRTATAFVADHLGGTPGDRLYRTGDVVRRLGDGTIAFLGRRDDQIKIRGFRVVLGEIDAALGRHPGVAQSVTVLRDESADERHIASYVRLTTPGAGTAADLRERLSGELPAHMIPRYIVLVDALPLSAHGKVDRGALPPPGASAGRAAHVAAANKWERLVGEVWQELLPGWTADAEANFFDSGGHSLLLVRLQHRLRAASGRDVNLLDLLQHTTVRAQARLFAERTDHDAGPEAPARTRTQNTLLKRHRQQLRARQGRDE